MAEPNRVGRPSNKQLLEEGRLGASKTCKICQSSVRDEITQAILEGETGRSIIDKYGFAFLDAPLTDTNIFSHKQHVDPVALAKIDRAKTLAQVTDYSDTTKALFDQRYSGELNKLKAADALYKQRLTNLFRLQHEIEVWNATEDERPLDANEIATRRQLIKDLEESYRGFNQDLLKHMQIDQKQAEQDVSLAFLKRLQSVYLEFIHRFMDVIVKEIEDTTERQRVIEQLGDIMDATVAPMLDPQKAIPSSFDVVETDKQ